MHEVTLGRPDGARRPGSLGILSRDVLWAVPLAVLVRLVFWLVTERVWEDALITIAHARNAVAGIGLTHHPGEPVVHGFTSALSVLIPLAAEIVSGGSGLFVLRVVSLVAAAVTIVAADALLGALSVSPWPRRIALVFLAVDPLQVFYGMTGMETQVAVAALLTSAWLATTPRTLATGISVGVCLLARPDFVIWAGFLLLVTAVHSRRDALTMGGAALATVAPWLIFTTVYYGSPIPQTIIAKSLTYATPLDLIVIAQHIGSMGRTFAPFYENTFIIRAPLPAAVAAAISIAIWTFVCAGSVGVARRAPALVAFFWAYAAYRLLALPIEYFDWYTPPLAAMGIILAAAGIDRWIRSVPVRRTLAIGSTAVFGAAIAFTIPLEATVQQRIEDGVREPVGIYLGQAVPRGTPVGLESAGYFGYYSRSTIWDYPGLTSATGLDAIRHLPPTGRSVATMLAELHPPWIVVRPSEWADLQRADPILASRYELCRSFDSGTGDRLTVVGMELRTVDDHFDVRALDGCPQSTD